MGRSRRFDAIVVGSGAAGATIARELGLAGARAVVLEQGRRLTPDNVPRDLLRLRHRHPAFADPDRHPLYFRHSEGGSESALAPPWAACVGGTTVVFSGNATRFRGEDFRQRSVSGSVAGAELADWPLAYDDLAPYYDRVEREVGVAGDAAANPFAPAPPPYPMPPYPRTSAGALFENAAADAGLHPFPAPKLINTLPYRGRAACTYQGLCSGHLCPVGAKGDARVTMLAEALAGGRVELRSEHKVTRLLLDARGRAAGVLYRRRGGRERRLRADRVFLCANAVECVRLLLLSAERRHPRGLLNNGDWVGRCFMTHLVSELYSLHPHFLGYHGNVFTRRVEDFYHQRAGQDHVGGFVLEEKQSPLPIRPLSPHAPRWGAGLVDHVRRYPNNVMVWVASGSCLPQRDNRVTLHPEATDAWGLPAARVTFDHHPADRRMLAAQRRVLRDLAARTDAKRWWGLNPARPHGIRPGFMGGTRMGKDPETSVVDADCRAHEVPRLYVVGSSVFPTSGRDAPAETIMALAMRTAARALASAET